MLRLITENQLDEWVRGNSQIAQEVIVELVWRLVVASCPNPIERRFPLGDSIGQHGPDGVLNTSVGFEPFIPIGLSYWEIGTGLDAKKKATTDYKQLTETIPENIRREATFVFVTPLSARRVWEYSWKEKAQAQWVEERRAEGKWKDVRVLDGTKLVEWLHHFPAVELWLVSKIHGESTSECDIETPEQRWDLLQKAGNPPLPPQIFLLNRDAACSKLKELLFGGLQRLSFVTRFPNEVMDFVAAYIASLDKEKQLEIEGRCLFVKKPEAWETIVKHYKGMILVAHPQLDLHSEDGCELLQKALQQGHKVITALSIDSVKDPAQRVYLPPPPIYQLQKSLEDAGYGFERARCLAQKSGGNLRTLVRLLQGLPLIPSWAQEPSADDLALAMLAGAWDERNQADCEIVEELVGKPYESWINSLRSLVIRPDFPLIYRNGKWKFILRYEAWYALGPRIFDGHLDRLKQVAAKVLGEKDPQFDLPKEERFAANFFGRVFTYSSYLRQGLAETLALLGAQPKALTSCSQGKAESVANLTVRELLSQADWIRWASLNDVLPLLAEAAPMEFLSAVEKAFKQDPCPFDQVFAQEGDPPFGCNYMTGLLWALETLAWDPDYLVRTVVCLGKLAARDPGGNWANRPLNSLTTILLPWLPQTCAPAEKRIIAVNTLLKELPEIGWEALLALLPQPFSVSLGSRRPAWRETIPEDWTEKVAYSESWQQVQHYAQLAFDFAKQHSEKLGVLVDRFEHLPPPVQREVLDYLASEEVQMMPEREKAYLWNRLMDLIAKHRKFPNAWWAMPAESIGEIEAVARILAPHDPALRYQRLFMGNKIEFSDLNREELEKRRQEAIKEIEAEGGLQAVLDFALSVENPWIVGLTYAAVADEETEQKIIPRLLDQQNLLQFAAGYVAKRFAKYGWEWVDSKNTIGWRPEQVASFLCLLPFAPATWQRAEKLLGCKESLYWAQVRVEPYQTDEGLEIAAEKLLKYNRPLAALRCIARALEEGRPINTNNTIKALLDALKSEETSQLNDYEICHEICEIIKALQNNTSVKTEELVRVEWAYLPLLSDFGVSPKTLEVALAMNPQFFCKLIRTVFTTEKEDRQEELTEKQKKIAENAHRLLRSWRTPPGSYEDGTFDPGAFQAWMEKVKEESQETGHLQIAMQMVGQVLIYAPPDPDGLWIHRAVAEALNAEDAEDMRIGFRIALYKAEGPKRELAQKYRRMAEKVESYGYYRLAGTLRELAETYQREAGRIAAEEED